MPSGLTDGESRHLSKRNTRQCAAFRLAPFTEEHGRLVCAWTYPPPYDLYNWKPWETMLASGEEFADPEIREKQYRSVLDGEGRLAGFAQLFPMAGVTRLGLGLRPDLRGTGLGAPFVRAIAEEALRQNPGHEIDLEVLTWNTRAIRTYEKAGFDITDTYERMTPNGPAEFHCMVWTSELPVPPDHVG
ncbi:GNAT family N-acetyltransferase [Paenibacillus sp. S-38]|uniref:GNAT family N-acetyltransferase n=1 Tax=Paenibacillus sp. S-38 TaxID=3416710 RepID=UPI003CFA868B